MADTSIEWTDRVWNPTTGCDRVSPGCDHCYAMTMAKRLKGMGSAKYQLDGDPKTSGPGFGVSTHAGSLSEPMKWKKPQRIFVNSMSDLFHAEVPDEFIAQVWNIMRRCPQHTFQILTKRPARMKSLLSSLAFQEMSQRMVGVGTDRPQFAHYRNWPLPNVWLGVSAEDQKRADLRIPKLLDTPAAVRFLSAEPLLGPIDLDNCDGYQAVTWEPHPALTYLDWVIVGGESGRSARPMDPDWARGIRDQCVDADVAFLFKQWGGQTPKANGRELDGRTWDQYPEARN